MKISIVKEGEKVTEADYRSSILAERIGMVTRKTFKDSHRAFEQGEEAIKNLEPEIREKINQYLSCLAEDEAKIQEMAYIGGFKDGVRLVAELLLIAFESRE